MLWFKFLHCNPLGQADQYNNKYLFEDLSVSESIWNYTQAHLQTLDTV